jgi:hypothetical protein
MFNIGSISYLDSKAGQDSNHKTRQLQQSGDKKSSLNGCSRSWNRNYLDPGAPVQVDETCYT